ncbi:MAG: hypothetical protein K2G64_05270 [Muribaculaceae bacterium]|nr:hypothetical protein [Muribaculaceae bacterium]MDE5968501.1 hypothetical protein [Muribaculaceae bacterium]
MKRILRPIFVFAASAVVVFMAAVLPEACTKQQKVTTVASIKAKSIINEVFGNNMGEKVAGAPAAIRF